MSSEAELEAEIAQYKEQVLVFNRIKTTFYSLLV